MHFIGTILCCIDHGCGGTNKKENSTMILRWSHWIEKGKVRLCFQPHQKYCSIITIYKYSNDTVAIGLSHSSQIRRFRSTEYHDTMLLYHCHVNLTGRALSCFGTGEDPSKRHIFSREPPAVRCTEPTRHSSVGSY